MKYIITFLWLPFLTFSQNKGAIPMGGKTEQSTSGATYAVVIGISDYQDKDIPDLRFADRDAIAFANFLQSPAGGSLDGDHLKLMINQDATGAQISMALDWLIEVSKENDQVIIYFSGHGDVETRRISSPGYLLGWNAPSRVYMSGGTVNVRDLQDIVSTLSVQNKAKVVLITDACHSGKLSGNEINGSQLTGQNLARQFANEVKILSCQPNEYSIEGEQWGGGRGVFSYHLVNSLYGLADANKDFVVSLKEIGRYLDDKVTTEVAPVNQNPQIIGNPIEILARVDANMLASMQSGNQTQISMLSPIETRGLEDEVLSGLDSTVKELYQLFKSAIKDKILLEPENACAESYYDQLIKVTGLARLHTTMTRNYASALQDDAQEAMNIWLKADIQQLQCIGKSLKLEPIPGLLARSAELLGGEHYMYRVLQARKLLFEGIIMRNLIETRVDEKLGRSCISLFRQSMELDPQSALPWYQMSLVYVDNLSRPDSAMICAEKARDLAPNWVLPYVDVGYTLTQQAKFDLSKQALLEAEKIDSLHPYVINRWASWYWNKGGINNVEQAIKLYEQYRESGGPTYPCWHNDYALALGRVNKNKEAEDQLKMAIAMDSTNGIIRFNLASLYELTNRSIEAEEMLIKAARFDQKSTYSMKQLGIYYFKAKRYSEAAEIFKQAAAKDSTDISVWANLAAAYNMTGRFAQAEPILMKVIALDSTNSNNWNNLGYLYSNLNRYDEAIEMYKKAIAWNSANITTFYNLIPLLKKLKRFPEAETMANRLLALDSTQFESWNILGWLYIDMQRYTEAEFIFKKLIIKDSTNKTAWYSLGYSYLRSKQYADAEIMLHKAIALDSNYLPGWSNLGRLYTQTHKFEEARKYLQKALSLNPKNTFAILGSACLLSREGKTGEAMGYVEQSIKNGITYEELVESEDLAALRSRPEWKQLIRKYFPQQYKE